MQKTFEKLASSNPLSKLIQKSNFMGWVYRIDYDKAFIMTNDLWKEKVKGIPHNCFLVASTFDPEKYSTTDELEKEVILFRVVGSTKMPQDDDIIRTKIDHFQNQKDQFDNTRDYDRITKNLIQFGALECRVLGTFFMRDSKLWLGSDIESFSNASRLNVYRPTDDALKCIVNYVDPIRKATAKKDAQDLGIKNEIPGFELGKIRYTSTDRLHRGDSEKKVPFSIQPSDFLARRTAVLGMTRTGKSNMIKQTVAVVKKVSHDGEVKIGQLIYDLNGEYANANNQDSGAISEVYPLDTERYRMLDSKGFHVLQNNFYLNVKEGYQLIREKMIENKVSSAADIKVFLDISFDKPEDRFSGDFKRWQRKLAAFQCIIKQAGYDVDPNFEVKFEVNKDIRGKVDEVKPIGNPKDGLSLEEATEYFKIIRDLHLKEQKDYEKDKSAKRHFVSSKSGENWVDDELNSLLNLLSQKNTNGAYITGYKLLSPYKKYHSSRRRTDVSNEIYKFLADGKIVILDLSVGEASLRDKISKQIAKDLFNRSMNTFISGDRPPNIVIYIEEAHNLIGKGMDLTETWPRLAKEGAKYKISLVYATQEVSSVHPNILSNTENWVITHLNNTREISELARFYDFDDFSRSLMRAQDVGFARVKTLSSPFVVPVQIDLFEPDKEKKKYQGGQ